MENETNKNRNNQPPTKKTFWGGYIVAGLIWTIAQSFNKSIIDEFIIVVITIGAGFFYYRLKSKIKFKNEVAKIIIAFVILEIVSGLLIGFLTSLANNWEAVAVRTPLGTEIATRNRDLLTQLNQNQKTYLADFQVRWDTAQNNVDDKTDSKVGYANNITAYKALQKLNDERQDKVVQYFNQASPILAKYSQNLVDVFLQLIKSDEKAKDVYNEIFTAKISYYQALIDNRPEAEISAKAEIVNNAVDKVNAVTQEGAQAQANYQKVSNEVFGR